MNQVGFRRENGTTSIPIWQGHGEDLQLAQGGFQLLGLTALPNETVIPAGTPLIIDESARTATFIGGAVLQAAATGNPVAYRVLKGAPLKVGDIIALTVGGGAFAITAIDTSNASYDVYTVGTTLGNAAVGAGVWISTATGANAAALSATINALLYDDIISSIYFAVSCSAVIRGTVYARRIPYAGPTATVSAVAGLKNIIFSLSK